MLIQLVYAQNDTLAPNQVVYNRTNDGRSYYSTFTNPDAFNGYVAEYYYDLQLKIKSVKSIIKVVDGVNVSNTTYYENGNKNEYIEYNSLGQEHGIYQEWYENGQLKISGKYHKGNPKGMWDYWTEEGKPK